MFEDKLLPLLETIVPDCKVHHLLTASDYVKTFRSSYEHYKSTSSWYNCSRPIKIHEGSSICDFNDDILRLIFTFCDEKQLLKHTLLVCKHWFLICTEVLFCVKELDLSNKFCYAEEYNSRCERKILFKNTTFLRNGMFGLWKSNERVENLRISLKTPKHWATSSKVSVPDTAVLFFTDNLCPRLKSLHLSGFLVATGNQLQECFWSNITDLTLNNCNLNEIKLAMITSRTKSLIKLNISNNPDLEGFSLINGLAQNKMESFKLNNCMRIKPQVIRSIFEKFSSTLKELHIMQCPERFIHDLRNIKPVKTLKSVCIDFFYFGINGVIRLKKSTKTVLHLMPELEEIRVNLISSGLNSTQNSNTNQSMSLPIDKMIVRRLSKLTKIELNIKFGFSMSKALDYSFLSQFTELREICISENINYSSFSEKYLSKCKNLCSLSIHNSTNFDFDHVVSVVYNVPQLQQLNLSSCHNLDGGSPINPRRYWNRLSAYRSNVLIINIRACKRVSCNLINIPQLVKVNVLY